MLWQEHGRPEFVQISEAAHCAPCSSDSPGLTKLQQRSSAHVLMSLGLAFGSSYPGEVLKFHLRLPHLKKKKKPYFLTLTVHTAQL